MWYSAGPKAHTVLIMKSSALFDAKHARSAPENQADPMSGLRYFVPLGHKGTLLSLAQWRVVELPTLCMRRRRCEEWHLLMQETSFYFHQMYFWLITLHWSMTAPHFASDFAPWCPLTQTYSLLKTARVLNPTLGTTFLSIWYDAQHIKLETHSPSSSTSDTRRYKTTHICHMYKCWLMR